MKAFPKITKHETPIFYEGKFAGYENSQDGMDLRDYFAAKAMQGIYSNSRFDKNILNSKVSEWAYEVADAMIEAREKK
jgi:hypothetical protein